MFQRPYKIVSFIIVCLVLFSPLIHAQETVNDKQILVSLRMIGHQVLLSSGDSTSRVMPIIKEVDRYRIQFETAFEFIPEELVATVGRVVKETKLAHSYIVEVETCNKGDLVYSFKMDDNEKSDIIPCQKRLQPEACYSLLFTLIEPNEAMLATTTDFSGTYLIFGALLALMSVLFYFLWKRRQASSLDPNMIALGAYQFDKRNTELLIEHQRIELTSKEAELLLLLHKAANKTVEREEILNKVWGDEGGYVGRTLDVFISKLRKKLEFDSKVKIVNIRGVGYKLVMDV